MQTKIYCFANDCAYWEDDGDTSTTKSGSCTKVNIIIGDDGACMVRRSLSFVTQHGRWNIVMKVDLFKGIRIILLLSAAAWGLLLVALNYL